VATFQVTDPTTGKQLKLTGDSAPTEAELEEIFASQTAVSTPDYTELAKEPGALESAFIAGGRGLYNVGRAVGLTEPAEPAEEAAIEALRKERPISTGIGEVVGEALPFVPAGLGVGTIPSMAGRIIAGTGLGITEGGLISRGRGEDEIRGGAIGGVIGGATEALFPVIGRMGSALIRKVTGKAAKGAIMDAAGKPTKELADALDASGISFDDLTQKAAETLRASKAGTDPKQAARLATLESLGAPATTGDITQDFAQQATEARLVESAADKLGDPLRTLRLNQSRAFKEQLDNQVNKLGVPDEVGDSIKSAIEGRKKLLTSEKNALYKQVGETAEDIKLTPILTDSIEEAIPSPRELRRLSRIQGNQAGAVEDLLTEFGVIKNPEAVEAFLKSGGEIDQLNVGNFEEFRQALNQIEKADLSKSTSVIIGPIKRALDEEANLVDDALRGAGITDESVLGTLKEARGIVRQIKTELSPQAISGRLIDVKRDGVTPIIESSKVFKELMGGQKAPELVERTIETLAKSPKGKKAIGDLQAATIVDLLDNAFKAQTRKIGSETVFGATAFNNRLNQIGERRLSAVFKNQPEALRKIKQIGKVSKDITPPSGAVPKGSASVILDTLNRLGLFTLTGKVPAVGLLADTLRTTVENKANRAVLDKALKAKPNVKKMATFIANDAPGLASALGISFLTKKEEKQ
jgi:hypothetical protein